MGVQLQLRDFFLFALVFLLATWSKSSTSRADTDNDDHGVYTIDSSPEEVLEYVFKQLHSTPSTAAALMSKLTMTKRLPRQAGKGCPWDNDKACNAEDRRIPICAGSNGNYRVYENKCELNRTLCHNINANIQPATIGKCQMESGAAQLTCHDILRGHCPKGTMENKVCSLQNATNPKSFRNICRVLHRRCKNMDDTCYHLDGNCPKDDINGNIPERKNCAAYILTPTLPLGRTCYNMSKSTQTKCSCNYTKLRDIPKFPTALRDIAHT